MIFFSANLLPCQKILHFFSSYSKLLPISPDSLLYSQHFAFYIIWKLEIVNLNIFRECLPSRTEWQGVSECLPILPEKESFCISHLAMETTFSFSFRPTSLSVLLISILFLSSGTSSHQVASSLLWNLQFLSPLGALFPFLANMLKSLWLQNKQNKHNQKTTFFSLSKFTILWQTSEKG